MVAARPSPRMLHLAVQHVVDALATYVDLRTGTAGAVVQSALVEPGSQGLAVRDKLVVTLVRLEEDRLSRPVDHYERTADDRVRRVEPPTLLTAYLLVAATHADYAEALKAVGHAVSFFQNARSVDYAEVEGIEDSGRLILEMDSPAFDQMNHLWGTVGAKYLPSVVYRMRMVSIRDARPSAPLPTASGVTIAGLAT